MLGNHLKITFFSLLLIAVPVSAEEKGSLNSPPDKTAVKKENHLPSLPLRVESPGARRLLLAQYGGWEDRDPEGYERSLTALFRFEYAFTNYFSTFVSQGFTERRKSETDTMRIRERFQLGINLAFTDKYDSGRPAFGFSLSLFEKQPYPLLEDDSNEYYLIRPHFTAAVRLGRFDLGGSFIFQSETNKNFKEGQYDEFRRHYQFEMFAIWNLNHAWKLHFETARREPYNKEIDIDVRCWHFYPGFSYSLTERHNFGFSLLVPLLEEGYADRGAECRYAFLF